MAAISKTAEAAKKAVAKSQQKEAKVRTWEQILRDMRINLDAKLAVTSGDIRMLLEAYDARGRVVTDLECVIILLKQELEYIKTGESNAEVRSQTPEESNEPRAVDA